MKKATILAFLLMMFSSCVQTKEEDVTCELNYISLSGIKYHQATFNVRTPFDITKEQQKQLDAEDKLWKEGRFDRRTLYAQVWSCIDTVEAISKSTGWCECKRGWDTNYEEEMLRKYPNKLKWIDK